VSLRPSPNWANNARLVVVGAVALLAVLQPFQAVSQEQLTRKVKSKVAPVYPDLARRMNITGTVRVVVVVSSNGTVKSTKLVGGHPIPVSAAMNALKKWKFEPAADESTGLVEFKFQPSD
jgi:TonB family protein